MFLANYINHERIQEYKTRENPHIHILSIFPSLTTSSQEMGPDTGRLPASESEAMGPLTCWLFFIFRDPTELMAVNRYICPHNAR